MPLSRCSMGMLTCEKRKPRSHMLNISSYKLYMRSNTSCQMVQCKLTFDSLSWLQFDRFFHAMKSMCRCKILLLKLHCFVRHRSVISHRIRQLDQNQKRLHDVIKDQTE